MGEGKPTEDDDSDDPALRIALRTTKLLEARRKKDAAKKMAKLMKNFNYDLLRGMAQEEEEVEVQPQGGGSICEELDLDDTEAERLRKLQEVAEEMASGSLLTQETGGCPKYEAPLITLMRSVETVNELYNLADQLIPLSTKRR
ncbi:uncharacterized protein LOC124365217 [Homalodisca vitripennis]|uniref:uncharacterized protein LOC124365217 n=1 Tax=Homalodisca vitripennis TaxID=197043 RepID=UPI001EEC83B9|nr:uncharacterized protein LOC124365217 [Homalodisca vitripennis]